jgi:hypothetical protein
VRPNELTTINNSNLFNWLISRCSRIFLNFLNEFIILDDSSKDGVLFVQMRCSTKANEKLRPIRVWTSVCHRQDSFVSMWIPNLLIGKLLSVNASASGTISCSDVATLRHESFNHSVENAVFVS